jgi:hypothetical protein
MNMSFIVRRASELKCAGAEILQVALSSERVRKILGDLDQRVRIYDALTTWLVFLGQTLAPDHSCRNAIAQARAARLLNADASVNTGAYCQARDRLPEDGLHCIATGLGAELAASERTDERWHGRRVCVVDGSSVALPDTPENQAAYPQPGGQAPGCGFPVMYICTLLSLASGALLDFATGGTCGNELALWRQLWAGLRSGDIVLGDRAYCSYADLAMLRKRGVDVVARLGIRKTDFRCGVIFGLEDHLVCWKGPKILPAWLGAQELPAELTVRELRFRVETPGFRSTTVTLVTTLTNAEVYTKEALAELYCCRWQVELRLRDIKTMLGMDRLRTRTPERARKELWMYLSAYNLLRAVMRAAAQSAKTPVSRVSFQGCRQRLLAIAVRALPPRGFERAYRRLLRDLAKDLIPTRPFRVEPRAVKRRPKQYDLLNKPRSVLKQKLLGAA